jgi:hypothetical protein
MIVTDALYEFETWFLSQGVWEQGAEKYIWT